MIIKYRSPLGKETRIDTPTEVIADRLLVKWANTRRTPGLHRWYIFRDGEDELPDIMEVEVIAQEGGLG